MSKVEEGKVVDIEYRVTLEDGEVADETDGQPMPYLHGVGGIIPGLEKALDGHEVGEKLTLVVPPEDAYGEIDPEATVAIPRESFPSEEVEIGDELELEDDDGEVVMGWIVDADDEAVHIDLNHPLAGETLTIEVEIVGVREPTEEEKAHGHAHDPYAEDEDGHHHHDA